MLERHFEIFPDTEGSSGGGDDDKRHSWMCSRMCANCTQLPNAKCLQLAQRGAPLSKSSRIMKIISSTLVGSKVANSKQHRLVSLVACLTAQNFQVHCVQNMNISLIRNLRLSLYELGCGNEVCILEQDVSRE